MLATLGPTAIATFDIIKNLERSAIMPAGAFAQVVTLLVSNRIGAGDYNGAKANIVKILSNRYHGKHCLFLCTYADFFVSQNLANT